MAEMERFLRAWVASSRDQEVNEAVSEISAGRATLLDIIKALGEYLTSEEDELRTKGVQFLSSVLEKCPREKLNRQAVRVLVTFYCDKLDDTETIVPALRGLNALIRLPNVTSSEALQTIRALFSHVQMKALAQSARCLVFSIIDVLVAHHRDALKAINEEFLAGYLRLAEGEKDPRNLIIAFAIERVLLIEFDIQNHVEDFFNAIFCYFPITFKPPPNDPYGVTADDLKSALCSCVSATPSFGPLAIPLFLEKVMAGSPANKRHALHTISYCLPIYGASTARSFTRELWSTLKIEVLHSTDPETEREALKTMQVVVNVVYANELRSQDVKGFAKTACEECVQILREPEKNQAKAAIKIVCALIATTPSVSNFTLSQIIPHLVSSFLNSDEVTNRPQILAHISNIISATNVSPESGGDILLLPYKDGILSVVSAGCKSSATATAALDCLGGLIAAKHLLSDEELGFMVCITNEIIQDGSLEFEAARDTALDVLSNVSLCAPRHIEEQTLPLLFASLPDRYPPRQATVERARYWGALSGLSKLCLPAQLFEILVVRLVTKVELLCQSSDQGEDVELGAAYVHSMLNTLANTLITKVDEGHVDIPKYIDRLVSRLLTLLISSALLPNNRQLIAADCRVIKVSAQIVKIIVEKLPIEKQRTFVASLYSAFLFGKVSAIAISHQTMPDNPNFLPLQNDASASQRNLLPLLAAATIPLIRDVEISVDNINKFLGQLVEWSLVPDSNAIQREAAYHIIASIVNKHTQDVGEFLSDTLTLFWDRYISDSSVDPERRRHAMEAWHWVTKALVVQDIADAVKFSDRLMDLFNDKSVSWVAAKFLGDLPCTDLVLTKRNHAVTKVLYGQKFFNRLLPRIKEGVTLSPDDLQASACLVALTSILRSFPKAIYATDFHPLIPLLIRGLELSDANIRANIIDTFLSVTDAESTHLPLISEHASTLINAMLKNCKLQTITSTRVRLSALRYLAVLPKVLRYDVLHPFKAKALRELCDALDDPKRSVRKEAVVARTAWFKCNG